MITILNMLSLYELEIKKFGHLIKTTVKMKCVVPDYARLAQEKSFQFEFSYYYE